jgi:foldase protein PrsA
MKDKVKGLILGITIGSLISGSVALASSSQIEVAFRSLKYMFDGVEKVPTEEKGFIYEGSTYVPLRFIQETLGKPVEWDEANETIWIGSNPNKVVATFKGGQVTQGQLDKFVAIQKFFDPNVANYASDPIFLESMVKTMIRDHILAERANEDAKAKAAEQANSTFEAWSGQGPDQLIAAMEAAGLTEDQLISFLTNNYRMEEAVMSSISTEALQAKYEDNLAADKDAYTIASVRHILIGLEDPQGAARTKEEALKRAQEVQVKLKNNGDFAALAKEYSDDPGSKANGGLYAEAPVNQWVEEFKQAAIDLPIGTLSEPVETSFGYHLIKVDTRSVRTLDQVKIELQGQLLNEQIQAFMDTELPGLIENIQLDSK